MRSVLVLLCLLLFAGFSAAQSTTVSGTVTDQNGQNWNNGTYSFSFKVAASNPTAQYYWNGTPFSSTQTISGNLNSSAAFSVSIPSNTAITPSGSTWNLTYCPAATAPCFTQNLTIFGATQNLTGAVIPPAVVVNLATPFAGAAAYTDAEILGAKTGASYWNLSDSTFHACSGFPPCTWLSIGTTSSILPSNNTFTGVNTFTQTIVGSINGHAASATTATNLAGPGTVTGNYSHAGTETFNGTATFNGDSTLVNPCAIDGVIYVSGAGCYTSLASAYAACPGGTGCIIDMRGASTVLALGTFDPGNGAQPLTILLGPYIYTATTLTLRTNLRLQGLDGTTIVEQSQTANLIQGPPGTDGPALNVAVENIVLGGPGYTNGCASGTTTATGDAIFVNANQSTSGGGLWYSHFTNMTACMFGGVDYHFRGSSDVGKSGINQFVSFYNVVGIRALSGGSALKMEGAMYQFFFNNCEFDSNYLNSNIDPSSTPNVFIGAGPGSDQQGYPYNIGFYGTTVEGAAVLVQVDGASNVVFDAMHHEEAYGAYKITYGVNGSNTNNQGIVVKNSSFNANVGIHSGSGYLVDVATQYAFGVVFENNIYASASILPDALLLTTSGADVTLTNWSYQGQTGGTGAVTNTESIGSCTLVAGACTHVFTVPYLSLGGAVFCQATPSGSGSTANTMKVNATGTQVVITSSSGSDTQVVNVSCNQVHN